MIRLIARMAVNLLANGLGILASAVLLDRFTIDAWSFVWSVIVLSISLTILSPLITKLAFKNAPYLIGGTALVTTLASLMVTDILSAGLNISGFSTWVLAALIVWVFSIIANIFLPMLIFKKILGEAKEKRAEG